ncbi:MAG: cytochrome c [Filimonas sp.]|nr:cytochrome c [Filimonas sp.]
MKKRNVLVAAFLGALCWSLSNCSKTNEVDLNNSNGGGTPCDTVNMKYSANVLPIIQANCYSCHANGQVNGGVTLGSYANVKAQVDNGNLVAVITHAAGYPAMPYNLPKLSDCDINKIKDWIARGAQNN